jgi:hypothetical protein
LGAVRCGHRFVRRGFIDGASVSALLPSTTVLQRQYADWEITGAPEIRQVTLTEVGPLNPFGVQTSHGVNIVPMLLWMR